MTVAVRTTPLLVIGLALTGCNKAPIANAPYPPQPRAEGPRMEVHPSPFAHLRPQTRAEKPRTEAASNLPLVELRIPHMF